jgi:hypothetical protein
MAACPEEYQNRTDKFSHTIADAHDGLALCSLCYARLGAGDARTACPTACLFRHSLDALPSALARRHSIDRLVTHEQHIASDHLQ